MTKISESTAHDLRNCLNRISMQAELAKMLIERGQDPGKLLASLNTILQACDDGARRLAESDSEAAQ